MASRQDVQKRQTWEVRLGRFRASGLTVTRFCEQERVSPNTFYYWAKRVGLASVRTSSPGSAGASRGGDRPVKHTSMADEISTVALVRFRWKTGVEVSVPADCLEAIRCLAESLAKAGDRRSEAFQEVVVKA